MFWVGNQGEGTSPCCTLFFSDFRTSFSFSLWLGWWDHFTRRTETFQKISNMYGYLFVHITLHGFFSEFSVVRGGGNDGTVSTGCGSPSVLHPWMLLLHMQETALWIPPVCCVLDDICKRQLLWILRGAFCPLEGGPRHIGTDTLAPVLQGCGGFPLMMTAWTAQRNKADLIKCSTDGKTQYSPFSIKKIDCSFQTRLYSRFNISFEVVSMELF